MEFAAAATIRAAAVLCEVGGVALICKGISWLLRFIANTSHRSTPDSYLNKSIWEPLSVLALGRLTYFTILLVFALTQELPGLTAIYDMLIQSRLRHHHVCCSNMVTLVI